MRAEPEATPSPSTGPTTTPPLASPPVQRDLIVRVTLQLVADDVGDAIDMLRQEAEDRGGRTESMRDARAESTPHASLALRVPVDALPAIRRTARSVARVTSDRETTEDVTSTRVDLDARIRNARAAEARLLALTADRTASLAEVLEAERELARVRESIETMEASARALADDVALAHVAIEISSPPPPPAIVERRSFADDPFATIGSSLGAGARFTYVATIACISALAAALPPALALFVLVLIGRALVRAARRVVHRLV